VVAEDGDDDEVRLGAEAELGKVKDVAETGVESEVGWVKVDEGIMEGRVGAGAVSRGAEAKE